MAVCEHCGGNFELGSYWQKFCSAGCRGKFYNALRTAARRQLVAAMKAAAPPWTPPASARNAGGVGVDGAAVAPVPAPYVSVVTNREAGRGFVPGIVAPPPRPGANAQLDHMDRFNLDRATGQPVKKTGQPVIPGAVSEVRRKR